MIFMQPQRLIVPLFQRPYVWNEESQWEPLWEDISRVAARLLASDARTQPHFLGAVVLQQVLNPIGSLQERIIIDGQQRLTTLQILLDALHGELLATGNTKSASKIETLVCNQEAFWERAEDRFKVWPTNRDRTAFNAAMSANPPIDYGSLEDSKSRLIQAHQYFAERARQWLHENGLEELSERALVLERTVRELLQVVVIDLSAEENAQEIFETLNARGAQLTAADLIKNFIFQRLIESGDDVEAVYERQWRGFETGFWESEIQAGRLRYARSSIFLNQWLIAKTGEEIVAREIFSRFKRYADFDSESSMLELVGQIHRSATQYRNLIEQSSLASGHLDRVQLFTYRTSVLESEVVRPFLLFLLDPDEPPVPNDQLTKALNAVESWMVRRMLVRATTKAYNQLIAELITQMRKAERSEVGNIVEQYLGDQTGTARYWPDDAELHREVESLLAYRRLRVGRVRMVLEAIEDYKRGFRDGGEAIGGPRVARGQYAVEHVMPRSWEKNWPLEGGPVEEQDRNRLIHTFGNLTLLTGRLNSKVSNGPWIGTEDSKREGIERHDTFFLNRELVKLAGNDWNENGIRSRTKGFADAIINIWPVPEGHRSAFSEEIAHHQRQVEVVDLISAGFLEPGQILYPRSQNPNNLSVTVLGDGSLEVDGRNFGSPSGAGAYITGHAINGWWLLLVDSGPSRKSLRMLRHEYVDQLAVDEPEDDDGPEDDDE